MFQKFFTDTLGSRFIKSLLAQTPIPIYDCVNKGDILVEGCYYVYKQYIIRCFVSGKLYISGDEENDLMPSDKLYPSVALMPGSGVKIARFRVVSFATVPDVRTHATFESSSNYYDSETHYHLGRYLRYLYTTTGLNLLPYYNCYSAKYVNDVSLEVEYFENSTNNILYPDEKWYPSKSIFPGVAPIGVTNWSAIKAVSKVNNKYKVVAVPIVFGKTYSVLVDCPSAVMICAGIYNSNGLIDQEMLLELSPDTANILRNSGRVFSRLSFKEPITYRLETNNSTSIMLQKHLYMFIQLPLHNDSSIVVFENFDPKQHNKIKCNAKGVREYEFLNPSLAKLNSKNSYAFSDRLIEYLLGHVVTPNDAVAQNIAMVQTAMATTSHDYKNSFFTGESRKGFWNSATTAMILKCVEDNMNIYSLYDQDGNFNKDIQSVVYQNGGIV